MPDKFTNKGLYSYLNLESTKTTVYLNLPFYKLYSYLNLESTKTGTTALGWKKSCTVT